jgi:hypothetical protein
MTAENHLPNSPATRFKIKAEKKQASGTQAVRNRYAI